MNLLELRNIHAAYERIDVLFGVDLVVPEGSVVALLGPNGAGKSTTLRVAAGLHPPTAGEVLIAGRRVNGVKADELARRGLCLIPEGKGIFPNLTVRENLRMMTYAGTSEASCIASRFKLAKMQSFEGPAGVIEYTFNVPK